MPVVNRVPSLTYYLEYFSNIRCLSLPLRVPDGTCWRGIVILYMFEQLRSIGVIVSIKASLGDFRSVCSELIGMYLCYAGDLLQLLIDLVWCECVTAICAAELSAQAVWVVQWTIIDNYIDVLEGNIKVI